MFSVLDGAAKIPQLVSKVKELGMSSIALTDHGVMSGVIDFYQECKKQGIKPILGQESYITSDPDDLPKDQRTKDNHHLVMMAMNKEGYENLLFLSSNAFLHNFYYKPRISIDTLAKYSKGIVATSACLGCSLSKCAMWSPGEPYTDPDGVVEKWAKRYSEIFEGRYYLEIQDNPDEQGQQAAYNSFLIQMGKRLGMPMVITSDSHYLDKADKETHDLLMAMQIKKTLAEYLGPGNTFKNGPWFYVRSPDEMWEAANKYGCPEAFDNTMVISAMCNVELELGKPISPVYDVDSASDLPEFEEWLKIKDLEDPEEHKTIGN